MVLHIIINVQIVNGEVIMENKEWHEQRLNGIGGSEASVVLGINPWQSRLELYNKKVERKIDVQSSDNIRFKLGHVLEPLIAEEYTKMTGRVLESRPQKIHPEYPFINGNVDREIVKSERATPGILEIKTKGAFINWEGDEIPPYYIAQLQQYLAVYNYTWGSFAVLDFNKFKISITDIERDDNLINKIIEEEKKFWKLVTNKTPPEIELSHQATEEYLRELFNTSIPEVIDVSDNTEATERALRLIWIKSEYKRLDSIETEYKNYFMNLMKESDTLIGKDFKITWKSDKDSTKFNVDRFKEDNPSLYNKYLEPKKGVRRFLSKFQKE